MTARFKAGDRVRVLTGNPPGHIRTPMHIRGKTGRVMIGVTDPRHEPHPLRAS